MSSFLLTLASFIRAFAHGLKYEEFRALLLVLVGLLVSGTIFYSTIEGWGLLDSLYFSVATLQRSAMATFTDYATVESFHHSLHSPRGRCLRSVHHQGDCPRDQAEAG